MQNVQIKNKVEILRYTLVFLAFAVSTSLYALTATEVMNKAASYAKAAKGIVGVFGVTTSGGSFTGSLKASGNKFVFATPVSTSWYNGKHMWSYNTSSKETTVVTPTANEISESNPLEYLRTYSANYSVTFSKNRVAGKYVVTLIPKSKKNQVRSVEITLNSKSFKPKKFVVIPRAGTAATVRIKSLDYSKSISASEFEYPKAKYPRVQIIDLR